MFVASAMVGASFTASTVIVKVLVLLSTPPLTVPPLSCAITVIVATPFEFAAGVKNSVPLGATLGATLNREPLLLLVTRLVTLCPNSSAGPAVIVARAAL